MRLLISKFLGDRRGNVAMTFGLAAIPILGVMGEAAHAEVRAIPTKLFALN